MNTFDNVVCYPATREEQHRTQTARNFRRAPVAVKVILQSVDHHRLEGITADIGGGGLFVEHRTFLQIGTELAVSLYLPDDLATPIRTIGQVVWVRRKRQPGFAAGMGIAFTGISESARDRLLCLIQSLDKMRFANDRTGFRPLGF